MENSLYSAEKELHTIIENLDADDESDSSDSESDVNDNTIVKRSRRTSLQRPPIFNGANKQRRRKTSCNDILPIFNREKRNSENTLPAIAITRSMSLPERLERCDERKKPTKGTKSATERLQLPGIVNTQEKDSTAEIFNKNNRNFRFLPNLGKCDSPSFSLAFRKKNSSEKADLDMFMRNHFR